jgi:hypothetical protein
LTEPPEDPTVEPHGAAAPRARLRLVPPLPAPGEPTVFRNPEYSRRTSSSGSGGDGVARPSLRALDPPPIPLRRPPLPPDDPPRGAA